MANTLTADMLTLDKLKDAMANHAAAFRCQRRLQPAGGAGTKIFPPTYAGATYAAELRRVPRDPADPTSERRTLPCVLIDSVQSQANRAEEALQQAIDEGRITLPVVEVEFPPPDDSGDTPQYPVGRITSLEAPHRLADAILRDSEYEGVPFRQSEIGRKIDAASNQNATPLYELGPTALVFGMWDSTGPRGGLGAKFERAFVSEIVGVDCPYLFNEQEREDKLLPKNHGLRRDPLNVSRQALVKQVDHLTWENIESDGKKPPKGAIRPSEINHGNVPFEGDNAGVTVDYCEQTTTLSLIALRRLRFPDAQGNRDAKRDTAAQTVLAALGLCAATLSADEGLDLRSRCLLWPERPMTWELLAKPGKEPEQFELDSETAIELLNAAIAEAKQAGVTWQEQPVKLAPSAELVKLVARSQVLEAIKEGDAE